MGTKEAGQARCKQTWTSRDIDRGLWGVPVMNRRQIEMFEPAAKPGLQRESEEWTQVVGFSGYLVSSLGKFKRADNHRPVKTTLMRSGYVHIGFCVNSKQTKVQAHRAVALAFLGNPPPSKPLVNHINGVRSDNRRDNLEWSSHSQNSIHGRALSHAQ
jgi:hypothetical protein